MATERVALVTGCSSGIGEALARELLARGMRVAATARGVDRLAALVELGAVAVELDVTDADSIARAVDRVETELGPIDLLVNNAGYSMAGPLVELPVDALRQMFETNVMGLVAVTREVALRMAARRAGRVVNVGSVVGICPTPFSGAYCASKAAVHTLSDVLRLELSPLGIQVVELQPGGVRSELARTAGEAAAHHRRAGALYSWVADAIESRARASQDRPMPADAFARAVCGPLLRPSPPRVVRAGRGARVLPTLQRLPGSVRDLLLRAHYKLNRPAPRDVGGSAH